MTPEELRQHQEMEALYRKEVLKEQPADAPDPGPRRRPQEAGSRGGDAQAYRVGWLRAPGFGLFKSSLWLPASAGRGRRSRDRRPFFRLRRPERQPGSTRAAAFDRRGERLERHAVGDETLREEKTPRRQRQAGGQHVRQAAAPEEISHRPFVGDVEQVERVPAVFLRTARQREAAGQNRASFSGGSARPCTNREGRPR